MEIINQLKSNYFSKMKGEMRVSSTINFSEILWSWIGSFIGIGAVSLVFFDIVNHIDKMMLIGSFGASAVLLFAVSGSPLAQPRNVLGGFIISALIGVTSYKLFYHDLWLASAIAVSTSIAVMQFTQVLHPPGGATALIAVIGSEDIHSLGYSYALLPVGMGAFILLSVALIINNIPKNRSYPSYWV
ncbi:HPP family protein [Sulfurovum sp. bin170]|uniref:HPP family protein n=1 Tax=Sulfurovum sp. bin170 TaxID=2695268 RepID=UPI0013DEF913|nr:HPP family protein [Sulfurovum sp. bin170]NEW60220.1 HPP family protein [Sulfurovum sp. bin170]